MAREKLKDEESGDEDWEMDPHREAFVEEFGVLREMYGEPRMQGRVLAYLMVSSKPYVSSAELARELQASAGSISTSARRLVELGFIARHAVPGDRSHYYRVDDDIWGSFLAGERRGLDKQRQLLDAVLADVPEHLEGPRRRLRNARNYMEWLTEYHKKMLSDWHDYNRTLDS